MKIFTIILTLITMSLFWSSSNAQKVDLTQEKVTLLQADHDMAEAAITSDKSVIWSESLIQTIKNIKSKNYEKN